MPKNTKAETSSKKTVTKDAKASSKVVAKAATKRTTAVKKTQAKKATKATKVSKATKKVAKKSTKKATKKTGAKRAAKKTTTKKTVQAAGSRTRFFKVVLGENDPHGRFSGSKPKQAAAKALTSILRAKEEDGATTAGKIKFSIVECTRGSRHKTYNYVGERIELDEPMEITIGKGSNAKVITYRFNNKVMKDKSA